LALFPTAGNKLETILNNSIPLKTEDDITNAVERFNQTIQQAAWNTTPPSSNTEIHIEYSLPRKNRREEEALQDMAD